MHTHRENTNVLCDREKTNMEVQRQGFRDRLRRRAMNKVCAFIFNQLILLKYRLFYHHINSHKNSNICNKPCYYDVKQNFKTLFLRRWVDK